MDTKNFGFVIYVQVVIYLLLSDFMTVRSIFLTKTVILARKEAVTWFHNLKFSSGKMHVDKYKHNYTQF